MLSDCYIKEPPQREPLNFGISLFSPISSVPGSSALFYLQPIFSGKVFASAGVLIGASFFLFLAKYLFRLENLPVMNPVNGETVHMSLPELQEFLRTLASNSKLKQAPDILSEGIGMANIDTGGIPEGLASEQMASLTTETAEAPMIFALAVYGDYSITPYSPSLFFLVPIVKFPGIRGSVPILILEILTTIFQRAVVPGESSGFKPIKKKAQKNNTIQFTPDELLKFLSRFSKHF